MKKVAFLTMDNLDNFESYDHLLYEPLEKLNWQAEPVPWRSDTDWNKYDVVLIRSTWDYQNDPWEFLRVLETIDKSSAHLENSLDLVKWNLNKTYLQDLPYKGIKTVPTIWDRDLELENLKSYFEKFQTDEIILKPVISANADNTFRINREATLSGFNDKTFSANLISIFTDRNYMVQPFMTNIIDEGEYSLFFFGGNYSHTILKTPKKNDFRVQEEHGATLKLVYPEPKMLLQSQKIIHNIYPLSLYARVDLVRDSEDRFLLMELEFIEPSLYFNMDPDSAERFAKIFDEWMKDIL